MRRGKAARLFSDADRVWLALACPLHRAELTAQLLDERRGRDVTSDRIVRAARRLGIGPSTHDGRIRKGHVPADKVRKGYSPPGCETGWSKRSEGPANTRPLYSGRWDNVSDDRARTPAPTIEIPGAAPYASQKRAGAHRNTRRVRKPVLVRERGSGQAGIREGLQCPRRDRRADARFANAHTGIRMSVHAFAGALAPFRSLARSTARVVCGPGAVIGSTRQR